MEIISLWGGGDLRWPWEHKAISLDFIVSCYLEVYCPMVKRNLLLFQNRIREECYHSVLWRSENFNATVLKRFSRSQGTYITEEYRRNSFSKFRIISPAEVSFFPFFFFNRASLSGLNYLKKTSPSLPPSPLMWCSSHKLTSHIHRCISTSGSNILVFFYSSYNYPVWHFINYHYAASSLCSIHTGKLSKYLSRGKLLKLLWI